MEPPWWLNWLADLASISGYSFAFIVTLGASIVGWILGYLPPAPPSRGRLQTRHHARLDNPPRVRLIDEVYGSAYRAIVGAHKSIADQFWLIVGEMIILGAGCVFYTIHKPEVPNGLPILPPLYAVLFYLIVVMAFLTVLLILRLHLRIRYENALR